MTKRKKRAPPPEPDEPPQDAADGAAPGAADEPAGDLATDGVKAAGDDRAAEEFPLWEGSFSGNDYVARLTNRGAALSGWTLQKFEGLSPESAEREKIELVTAGPDGAVARTSFPKLGLGDLAQAHYRVESVSNDRAVFALERDGLSIRKIYEFDFEQYRFELTIQVHNGSNRSVAPELAIEWPGE